MILSGYNPRWPEILLQAPSITWPGRSRALLPDQVPTGTNWPRVQGPRCRGTNGLCYAAEPDFVK